MSRHESRQKLAREFGATDIVPERGDEAVARVLELTGGIGADSVLECVGTQESMQQAIRSTRPGGSIGYVGVPHGVEIDGEKLFWTHVHLHGGPATARWTSAAPSRHCCGRDKQRRSNMKIQRVASQPSATGPAEYVTDEQYRKS